MNCPLGGVVGDVITTVLAAASPVAAAAEVVGDDAVFKVAEVVAPPGTLVTATLVGATVVGTFKVVIPGNIPPEGPDVGVALDVVDALLVIMPVGPAVVGGVVPLVVDNAPAALEVGPSVAAVLIVPKDEPAVGIVVILGTPVGNGELLAEVTVVSPGAGVETGIGKVPLTTFTARFS